MIGRASLGFLSDIFSRDFVVQWDLVGIAGKEEGKEEGKRRGSHLKY